MADIPGIEKPLLQSLPQLQSRMTFLYLERCLLKRADGAIEIWTQEGVIHLPAACLCAILLGPGTNITHQAVELIAEAGVTLIWTGEEGVRYYASGRPMTRSSAMLIRQATLVSNTRMHLTVAKMMYQIRYTFQEQNWWIRYPTIVWKLYCSISVWLQSRCIVHYQMHNLLLNFISN